MQSSIAVLDTPLLLAIKGHQDLVVKVLLEKGVDVNEGNTAGELPLARNLESVTALTSENDGNIFDMLVSGGATMEGASEAKHPLLAICKVRPASNC